MVSVVPAPLLGHPETRGIVGIENAPLRPCDIELLLLTQPDIPLTPAAEYFVHCLASVYGQESAPDNGCVTPALTASHCIEKAPCQSG